MQIKLKDWKRLEGIIANLRKAIEIADCQSFDIACEYPGDTTESETLHNLNGQIHELRGKASLLLDCHPQSEWTGGNSDDPKNHRLREPNCCPAPRRYFTAKLKCIGPVQWISDTE